MSNAPCQDEPCQEESSPHGEGRFIFRVRQSGRAWELIHPHQPAARFRDQIEAFERAECLARAHRRETRAPSGVVFEVPGIETLAAQFG